MCLVKIYVYWGAWIYFKKSQNQKLKKIQKKPKKCLFFEGSDCIKKENKKTI